MHGHLTTRNACTRHIEAGSRAYGSPESLISSATRSIEILEGVLLTAYGTGGANVKNNYLAVLYIPMAVDYATTSAKHALGNPCVTLNQGMASYFPMHHSVQQLSIRLFNETRKTHRAYYSDSNAEGCRQQKSVLSTVGKEGGSV